MSLVVYIVEVLVHHHKIITLPLNLQINNFSLPGFTYPSITATLAFYFVSLFEVQGVLNGMASLVNLFDAKGQVPGRWVVVVVVVVVEEGEAETEGVSMFFRLLCQLLLFLILLLLFLLPLANGPTSVLPWVQ